jgi:hypothetical protein
VARAATSTCEGLGRAEFDVTLPVINAFGFGGVVCGRLLFGEVVFRGLVFRGLGLSDVDSDRSIDRLIDWLAD